MLQFSAKTLQQFQLVKSDPKVADLIGRIERNVANLGTLSGKAFKLLTKMTTKQGENDVAAMVTTYDSLAVYADKMEQCRQL